MTLTDAKKLIKQVLRTQIKTGVRLCMELISGPGVGKSEGAAQVAQELTKEMGEPVGFLPFFLCTKEPPDIGGYALPAKDTDGSPILRYTAAPWMPRAGSPKYGIILLDEFRQAAHDVQKTAAELLLNGRVGDSQLPIEWLVLLASNREKDRSGVQRELAFITNRRMAVNVDPNLDAWVGWAERERIHWSVIAFAKRYPGLVFKDSVPDKPGPYCSPRSLVKTSYLVEELDTAMFAEAAAGMIGEGTAAQFVAFLRVIDESPSFEDIVANPDTCRLPKEDRPDAQYATMQMLSQRVDGSNCVQVFTYLKRMPKEFQVAGLQATLRCTPQILRSKGFPAWLRENKDLLIGIDLLNAA